MGEVLKPCPFCGGQASLRFDADESVWSACCYVCDTYQSPNDDESEAIAAWNRRQDAPEALAPRNAVCCEHMAYHLRKVREEAEALATLKARGFTLSAAQEAKIATHPKGGGE
jgi:Lar family restriction alleviation protein